MMIFVLTGAVVIVCLTFLPETLGKPIKEEIEEVELYINENNQNQASVILQRKWRSSR